MSAGSEETTGNACSRSGEQIHLRSPLKIYVWNHRRAVGAKSVHFYWSSCGWKSFRAKKTASSSRRFKCHWALRFQLQSRSWHSLAHYSPAAVIPSTEQSCPAWRAQGRQLAAARSRERLDSSPRDLTRGRLSSHAISREAGSHPHAISREAGSHSLGTPSE